MKRIAWNVIAAGMFGMKVNVAVDYQGNIFVKQEASP
jgi:hypothetical protein